MHGLAAVPERQLSKALRVTHHLGPFGPSVAIAVQRHTGDPEAETPLPKLRGAMSRLNVLQIREK